MDCKFSKDLVLDLISQRGETPLLIMPVAASGAGKTTFTNKLVNEGFISFSPDDLRLAWYDPDDYDRACALSREDPKFDSRMHQEFISIIKTKKDIVLDRASVATKPRTFFLAEAHRHGYKSIAVLFPCKIVDLIARQKTRPDKSLSPMAVLNQNAALALPSYGEFHDIMMVIDNIEP